MSGYFKATLRLYNPAQAGHPPDGSDSACEPAAAFFDTHELLSWIFFLLLKAVCKKGAVGLEMIHSVTLCFPLRLSLQKELNKGFMCSDFLTSGYPAAAVEGAAVVCGVCSTQPAAVCNQLPPKKSSRFSLSRCISCSSLCCRLKKQLARITHWTTTVT